MSDVENNGLISMVDRFLAWKLPDDFSPDGGIAFKQPENQQHWPSGTNLLTADQAREMILHIIGAA